MKVELVIHAVAGSAADGDRSMLLLKEKDGSRILPIMMSTRRAVTVMMRSRVPMPMPVATSVPDASLLLLRKFGIEIKRMELTSIKDAVFICKLVGEQDGVEKQLDFLPANDGIVLATMAPCPSSSRMSCWRPSTCIRRGRTPLPSISTPSRARCSRMPSSMPWRVRTTRLPRSCATSSPSARRRRTKPRNERGPFLLHPRPAVCGASH